MKKYLLGFVALIVAATFAYAFTTKEHKEIAAKESKALTVRVYEFTGVPNPPSQADVTNTSKWTVRTAVPSCPNPLDKFCYITFDDANTSLSQALTLLQNNYSSISDGAQFQNGSQIVTIFMKQ